MSEPVTVRIDPELRKRFDDLARATDRTSAALAAEAVRQFVELNEWQVAAIHEGVRDADDGQFIDNARRKANWEKRLAAALEP